MSQPRTAENFPEGAPGAGSALLAPAVGPQKLSDVVYERVLAQIAAGKHPIGGRLPPEHQLALEFQVSRPIVREALARLRDDGVVQSRRGSGTYVQRSLSRAAMHLAPISSIADMGRCFEFRISYEGEVAFHAALSEDDESRAALGEAFEKLDAAVHRNELGADEDYDFHTAIARATGNRFFEAVMLALRESALAGMTVTRSLSLMRPRERLLAVHQEHRDIFEAIMSKEPDRARQAMRLHLSRARQRVFEGTDR